MLSPDELAAFILIKDAPDQVDLDRAELNILLACKGVYIATELISVRVLREHGKMTRRGRARIPSGVRLPTTHVATAPRRVWCWDPSYFPATVTGRLFHL